jgi:hypothetical protein
MSFHFSFLSFLPAGQLQNCNYDSSIISANPSAGNATSTMTRMMASLLALGTEDEDDDEVAELTDR